MKVRNLISVVSGFFLLMALAVALTSFTGVSNAYAAEESSTVTEWGKHFEEGTEISRAEWLSALAVLFDMNVADGKYPDNYFSDLDESSEYYYDVLLTVEFGVVAIDAGDPLYPDEPITREFAAQTLNYCLAFTPKSDTYGFCDYRQTSWPDDLQVALERGWFDLTNMEINPSANVSAEEGNDMLADADEVWRSLTVDPGHKDSYELASDVVEVPEDASYEFVTDETIKIEEAPADLQEDRLFVVYAEGLPCAYKAETVTENPDGTATVDVVQAEPGEAFVSADIATSLNIDALDLVAANEVKMTESRTFASGRAYGYESEGETLHPLYSTATPKQYSDITIPVKERKLEYDKGTFKVTATLKDMAVNVIMRTDTDEYAVTISGYQSVVADLGQGIEAKLTLMGTKVKVPFGFEIAVNASANGQVTLTESGAFELGFAYSKAGGMRTVKSFTKNTFQVVFKVDASITLDAVAELNTGIVNASVTGSIGAKGYYQYKTYYDGAPYLCETSSRWFYLGVYGKLKLPFKEWPFRFEFSERNSPFRYYAHWEDGKQVFECCRGKAGDSNDAKYITQNDIIGDRDNPSATWKESITLNSSCIVSGDLTIKSGCRLDLNGYTLVVYGNMNNSGELWVSGGKLIILGNGDLNGIDNYRGGVIKCVGNLRINSYASSFTLSGGGRISVDGNLTHCCEIKVANGRIEVGGDLSTVGSGALTMAHYQGVIDVEGDVKNSRDEYSSMYKERKTQLSAGTLYIGGDFLQTGTGFVFCATGSHLTVFDGKDVQRIKMVVYVGRKGLNVRSVYGNRLNKVRFDNQHIKIDCDSLYSMTLASDLTYCEMPDTFETYSSIKLGTHTLNCINDNITLDSASFKIEQGILAFSGDVHLNFGGITVGDGILQVAGDLDFGNSGLSINTGRVEVFGNLSHGGNHHTNIRLGSGTLHVRGNCSTSSWAYLIMEDPKCLLDVDGDLILNNTRASGGNIPTTTLHAGTLRLAGNLRTVKNMSYDSSAYRPTADFVTIFDGDSQQMVHFDFPTVEGLSKVKFENNNIVFDTAMEGFTLLSDMRDFTVPSGNLSCSKVNLNGFELTLPDNCSAFSPSKLEMGGGTIVLPKGGTVSAHTLTGNGGQIVSFGDLILGTSNFHLNNGRIFSQGRLEFQNSPRFDCAETSIEAKNGLLARVISIKNGNLTLVGNSELSILSMWGSEAVLETDGDLSVLKMLEMSGNDQLLRVHGDFKLEGWDSSLKAGTIELYGSMTMEDSYLTTTGLHRIVACGDKAQTFNLARGGNICAFINAHEDEDEVVFSKAPTSKYSFHDPAYKTGDRYIGMATLSTNYTGSQVSPTVMYGDEELIEGVHYSVVLDQPITHVGESASATLTGIYPYKGTFVQDVTIKASIADAAFEEIPEQVHTGKAAQPEPIIIHDGRILTKGADYTVSWGGSTKGGEAIAYVYGRGNYSGTLKIPYTVAGHDIVETVKAVEPTCEEPGTTAQLECSICGEISSKAIVLDELGHMPKIFNIPATCEDNGSMYNECQRCGYRLQIHEYQAFGHNWYAQETRINEECTTLSCDFICTRDQSHRESASFPATITNIADEHVEFYGETQIGEIIMAASIEVPIDQVPKELLPHESVDISTAVIDPIGPQMATGSELKPQVVVRADGTVLRKDVDYTVSYENNVSAGTGVVTIAGIGLYSGEKTVTFTIVEVESPSPANPVNPVKPIDPNIPSTPAAPSQPSTPQEPSMDVADAAIANLGLSAETISYTGSAVVPQLVVKVGDKTLVEGKDYDLAFEGNTDAGTAHVTISGKGAFKGAKTFEFTIEPAQLDEVGTLELAVDSVAATGNEVTPEVVVKAFGCTLESGKDYDVSYGSNVEPGEAIVTITGKGNYKGQISKAFAIVAPVLDSGPDPKPGSKPNSALSRPTISAIVPGWHGSDVQGWYYLYRDGTRASNGFKLIDGTWYAFDKEGAMLTGWYKDGGRWYYLCRPTDRGATGSLASGWKKIGGRWYHLNTAHDGTFGAAAIGWRKVNGAWYCFNRADEGIECAMRTGWVRSAASGLWYYHKRPGEGTEGMLHTGWLRDGAAWYYLSPVGGAGIGHMVTGWNKIDGSWYYFNSSGVMAVNTWVGPYRVGSTGAWQAPAKR